MAQWLKLLFWEWRASYSILARNLPHRYPQLYRKECPAVENAARADYFCEPVSTRTARDERIAHAIALISGFHIVNLLTIIIENLWST